MGTSTLPQIEDVVMGHRSPDAFTIGVSTRAPQIRCRTFDEAVQRAGGFATHAGAHVWLTTDVGDYVRIESDRLLRRMWDENVEMPGLRLTRAQARRLWSLDESTCRQLLGVLVRAKLLICDPDGRYARAAQEGRGEALPGRMVKANIVAPLANLQRVG